MENEILYGTYHYVERQIVEIDNLIIIDKKGMQDLMKSGYLGGVTEEEVLTCVDALVNNKNCPLKYKKVLAGAKEKKEMSLKQCLEQLFKLGATQNTFNYKKCKKILDKKEYYTKC